MTTFAVNDKVQITDLASARWAGQVGTVTKVNTTTVGVTLIDGRSVRIDPYMLKPYEGEVIAPSALPEHLPCGAVVRFVEPSGAARFPGLYVVIRDNGDKTKVARLGGENDRFVTSPRSALAKVEVAEILKDGLA